MYIVTAWLLVHHPHGSDPWGRNTRTWVTSWRHPDSHQQTSVHLLMHAPRYSVKGGNIQPKWRYSLVDQTSMTISPYIWGGPSSFGGEKRETKTFLLHWFQQCSSFWDHSYKSSYFPMSTYGTSAGRAALYPDNAGQNTHVHCDHIHNDDYLWHLSTDQVSFAKWSSGV